jgi:hypothetical protein
MATWEGECLAARKTAAEPGRQVRKEYEMAVTAISRVLDEVKRLTPDEQRQLREAIDQLLSRPAAPLTEEQFERELVESGILDEVPPPPGASEPLQERKSIDVKGKPLSETIVEDRR